MEFRNSVTITAPAISNNTIQRVQRGTNRPVGKISGKIRKHANAANPAGTWTHSQAGWRTVRVNASGISVGRKVATMMEAKSTIQLSDFRQNNPAAISK